EVSSLIVAVGFCRRYMRTPPFAAVMPEALPRASIHRRTVRSALLRRKISRGGRAPLMTPVRFGAAATDSPAARGGPGSLGGRTPYDRSCPHPRKRGRWCVVRPRP